MLPASGTITFDNIRVELSLSGTISLNVTGVRTLAGKASGIISMSDLRGKSSMYTTSVVFGEYKNPAYDVGSSGTTDAEKTALYNKSLKTYIDYTTSELVYSGTFTSYTVQNSVLWKPQICYMYVYDLSGNLLASKTTTLTTSGQAVSMSFSGIGGKRCRYVWQLLHSIEPNGSDSYKAGYGWMYNNSVVHTVS